MPLKFWKREKPEKEKADAGKEGTKAPSKRAEAEPAKKPDVPEAPKTKAQAAEEKSTKPAGPEPTPADVDAAANDVHAALVDLGLTIPGTKAVFIKRVSGFPGGGGAFARLYREKPYRAGTEILAAWLGFRVPAEFDPAKLLADVNLRLSSFKLSLQIGDLTWLDEELGLRKARLRLGEQEKVVRFKDARDFVKGVNELLAPKKMAFLELETWSSDHAFLLVREPKWDKLAATALVVVKAPQTAVGGECGECGAPVGANWRDCLSCGAVFGSD